MASSIPVAVCGGCTARWQSWSLAHCASCHESFSSPSLFDRHRLHQGEHGRCEHPSVLPAKRGGTDRMVNVRGVWREPARWVDAA